jgi:CRISPR-associated endonuclease Csn1
MKRTLGLDLGTNSIGWAIVEEENGAKRLVKGGSVIFPEGVARVKGSEVPATEERTRSRAMRRLYMRRRMRKHRLLRTLMTNGMCPLSDTGLNDWIKKDQYPLEDAFVTWFRMNPYELRAKGLQERLTPLELGRVFYHMAQRRGFQSNRKGGDGEQESFHEGLEEKGIAGYNDTKRLIAMHGTLGKAGAELAKDHTPIRKRYFKRSDLVDEFNQLWEIQQGVNKDLNNKLRAQIGDGKTGDLFYQRPLKGKKSEVGRCTLEPGKRRAPISSIQAELFGVLQTINNIRKEGRMLNADERGKVMPLFFRRSKPAFEFSDVTKALKLKGAEHGFNYAAKDKLPGAKTIAHLADLWDTDAMEIVEAFGSMAPNKADLRKTWEDRYAVIYNAEDWADISERKAKGQDTAGKRDLKEYAITQWSFGDEQLKLLERFDTKQGYHSLSSRALGRIIPLMYGSTDHPPLGYHDAVVLANLPSVFKVVHKAADGKTVTHIDDRWAAMSEAERSAIYKGIRGCMDDQRDYTTETILLNGLIRAYRDSSGETGGRIGFWNSEWEQLLRRSMDGSLSLEQKRMKGIDGLERLFQAVKEKFIHHIESHQKVQFEPLLRMEDRVKNWLIDNFDLLPKDVAKLYHHSAISTYKEQTYCLGDPKTPGLKNPMVYRALHTLRMLVNKLIEAKEVDRKTQVNIEMARELDSANKRKAWQRYQNVMRKKNEDAEKAVREYYASIGNHNNPTDDAIERMWLLDEARQVFGKVLCVYTGKEFGIADLFNGGVEVEHTWPRSKTVDNSMANKMLCMTRYNRDVKKERLPAALPNYSKDALVNGAMLPAIVATAEPIKELWERYDRIVYACKMSAKSAATKEAKDKAIQDRWFNQFFRDYWRTKYEHLTAEEIKPGFRNRQLVAAGQISKLARAYMNSYFNRVECLKPEALSALRKEWLGESLVHAKDRSLHTHHAVDAAVCAAVDRVVFDALAHHYEEHDEKGVAASFDPPWKGFGADMASLRQSALVYHVHKPVIGRTSIYQRTVRLKNGEVVQVKAQGDTVRGSLHKDTYYGKIKLKKAGTEDYEEHVVLRKPIVGMSKADMAKVVDPALRQALLDADPDTIEKHRGLPWKGKHKGVPVTRVVKHARVFDRSVKNPVALKAHRDKLDGTDHKHHLWVKNDETPVMAIYENAKGKSTHYVFSLLELTLAQKGKQGRDLLMQAIPAKHPDPKREGYTLKYRNGKPMVLQAGQLVRLFKDGPEEIDHNDQVDLNRRTYVLRKVEADGRVNLLNVLEARPDDQIDETNQWKPEQPLQWLRFSVHGLKAEIDGIDTTIGMVHT